MNVSKKVFAVDMRTLEYSIIGTLILLALALRISFYPARSSDMMILDSWTDFIRTHGGFAALQHEFANYNMPYLYLLTLFSFIPIPTMFLIKTVSVVFDGALAWFVYRLLRLKYTRSPLTITLALVTLFVPTIFINSAAWGQCDSIYTAFCLGSLYFLLRERTGWACVFFGLAFAFKLQAIFFAPVLLLLFLKRKLSWKPMLLAPTVFLLLLVPALLAGRGVGSVLTIYADQALGGGGGTIIQGPPPQDGQRPIQGQQPVQISIGNTEVSGQPDGKNIIQNPAPPMTMNAPSIYQWFPVSMTQFSIAAPSTWQWMGIVLAGAVVLLIAFLVMVSKTPMTAPLLIKLTLALVLIIPFLLPKMHERYFYLADIISIVYVFYVPHRFYVAILVQLCSLLSYMPYLFGEPVVNLKYVAFGVLLAIMIILTDVVLTLYPDLYKTFHMSNSRDEVDLDFKENIKLGKSELPGKTSEKNVDGEVSAGNA